MDSNNEGNPYRKCYSREFLLKYDRYKPEPDIVALVNALNNSWPRSTPKKVANTNRLLTENTDSKSPGSRLSKNYLKKKVNGKPEKNARIIPGRLRLPESKSDENDSVSFRALSVPAALKYSNDMYEAETPRKIASSPVIGPYPNLFPTTKMALDFDTTNTPRKQPEVFGEQFDSLFSQPPAAEICGEMNLKPYLSLDFIEDQPASPSKTPSKIRPSTPKVSEAIEKSPFRNSKTPQKSPRSRPISPLDDQRLIQRQKQIDYGYRTVGYLRYRLLVAKDKRKPEHPRTPKKAQGCSKRSWDGQLKKWRRDLHLWDPDNLEAFRALLNSEVVETVVNANPELAEVVRAVREKLDNPSQKHADEEDSDDDDDLATPPSYLHNKTTSSIKNADKNQVISGPKLTKVARTLVF
jgi:hypothetical protein